jgi:hypothetical protein
MDVQEFELFLERMEDETLDFKSKMYDLAYDWDKARLRRWCWCWLYLHCKISPNFKHVLTLLISTKINHAL